MGMCDGYCGGSHRELFKYDNKQYCESCYNRIKYEGLELQALKNYIKYIFKYNSNKMINNQIEKYHKENGWSYKNIRLTLEYIVVIKEMEMQYKFGIGLVPYYYDDMIAFHKERIRKAKEMENSVKKSKHITVNKKQDSMHKFNKNRMVNMDDLEDDNE